MPPKKQLKRKNSDSGISNGSTESRTMPESAVLSENSKPAMNPIENRNIATESENKKPKLAGFTITLNSNKQRVINGTQLVIEPEVLEDVDDFNDFVDDISISQSSDNFHSDISDDDLEDHDPQSISFARASQGDDTYLLDTVLCESPEDFTCYAAIESDQEQNLEESGYWERDDIEIDVITSESDAFLDATMELAVITKLQLHRNDMFKLPSLPSNSSLSSISSFKKNVSQDDDLLSLHPNDNWLDFEEIEEEDNNLNPLPTKFTIISNTEVRKLQKPHITIPSYNYPKISITKVPTPGIKVNNSIIAPNSEPPLRTNEQSVTLMNEQLNSAFSELIRPRETVPIASTFVSPFEKNMYYPSTSVIPPPPRETHTSIDIFNQPSTSQSNILIPRSTNQNNFPLYNRPIRKLSLLEIAGKICWNSGHCKFPNCRFVHTFDSNILSASFEEQRQFWNEIVRLDRIPGIIIVLKVMPSVLADCANDALLFDMVTDILRLKFYDHIGPIKTIINALLATKMKTYTYAEVIETICKQQHFNPMLCDIILSITVDRVNFLRDWHVLELIFCNMDHVVDPVVVNKIVLEAATNDVSYNLTESIHKNLLSTLLVNREKIDVNLLFNFMEKLGDVAHVQKVKASPTITTGSSKAFSSQNSSIEDLSTFDVTDRNDNLYPDEEEELISPYQRRDNADYNKMINHLSYLLYVKKNCKLALEYMQSSDFRFASVKSKSDFYFKQCRLIKHVFDALYKSEQKKECKDLIVYLINIKFDINDLQVKGNWDTYDYYRAYITEQIDIWGLNEGDIVAEANESIFRLYKRLKFHHLRDILILLYSRWQLIDFSNLVMIFDFCYKFYNQRDDILMFNKNFTLVEIQMVTHIFFFKLLNKNRQVTNITIEYGKGRAAVTPKLFNKYWDESMPIQQRVKHALQTFPLLPREIKGDFILANDVKCILEKIRRICPIT